MKKLFLLIVYLLIVHNFVLSQETWEHEYDPFGMDGYKGEDVVKCSDGGYAFNGSCYIEDPWDPGNYLEYYGFTMKTDIDGIIEWVKKDTVSFIPMNQGSALVQTSDGGFLTAVIPWLAGQGALIKRDSYGNREWVINPGLWVHSMANTNDGNIVIVGGDYEGLVFQKWSLLGEVIWTKSFDDTILKSVFKSQDEGFLLTGYKDANGGPFEMDIIVIKTDSNGDTLWTRTYDGFEDWDEAKCVIETSNNDIIVVGESHDLFRSIYGVIWCLNQEGGTNNLIIVDHDISHAIWTVKEFIDNSIITWGSGPSYIARFNRFDIDLNYIDTMPSSCSQGDKAFIVEGEYLIFCKWPNITITKILFEPVAVDENIAPQSNIISLNNYPNPFNPSTTINYFINQSGIVYISIYNLKGQKIKTLVNKYKEHGEYKIIWYGNDERNNCVSSGVYSAVLSLNAKNKTIKKLLLIK